MLATLAKRLVAMDDESCKSNLAVFGDSYSDTGNLFYLTAPGGVGQQQPDHRVYDDGRYTNGKVWVEYFAQFMNFKQPTPYNKDGGTNYAIAGSATGNSETTEWTNVILGPDPTGPFPARGLMLQTDDFLEDDTITKKCAINTNYVVWSGAVDMMLLGTDAGEILLNIEMSIRNLTNKGAREITVLNLPQLAHSPAYVHPDSSIFISSDLEPTPLEDKITKFNNDLPQILQSIVDGHGAYDALPNFTYTLVDMAALFAEAAENPDMFCLAEEVTTATLNEPAFYLTQVPDPLYLNSENALWYDGVHPTTTFHKAIAKEVKRVVTGKSQKAAKNPNCKGSKVSKVGKA